MNNHNIGILVLIFHILSDIMLISTVLTEPGIVPRINAHSNM